MFDVKLMCVHCVVSALPTPEATPSRRSSSDFYSLFNRNGAKARSLAGWAPPPTRVVRSFSICGLSDAAAVLATGTLELAAAAYAFHANVFSHTTEQEIDILITDVNNAIQYLGLNVPLVDKVSLTVGAPWRDTGWCICLCGTDR